MVTYKYKAISKSGAEVEGVLKAHDQDEAVIQLKEEFSLILDIKEIVDLNFIKERTESTKINEKNLSLMCKQFSILLTAGLPIARTVELVGIRTEDKVLKKMLMSVAEDVSAGYNLADSFQTRGEKLPVTFIETVRAGEESGALEIAFERLAKYFEKKATISAKVRSALTYPAFVIAVAVVVIVIIMAFAVPVFTKTFAEMGVELPLVTRSLIAVSNFCSKWFIAILTVIVAIIVGFRIWAKSPKGSIKWGEISLKMPVLGPINTMNAASTFAGTFCTMVAAGLPAIKALAITGKTLTNGFLSEKVLKSVEKVEQGFKIGDAMRDIKEFPELLTEMTAVGEEAGSMEHTLSVIGEFYDQEVMFETDKAVKLLEPSIICVLAVFVVWILLAVYLPMFSMYNTATM